MSCNECQRLSNEAAERWGFKVQRLCDKHRNAIIDRVQGHRMSGKRGNAMREGLE